ncbi:hypothetical protein [Bradyrhizobium elkanii]|uniref:hypothetical protein n=1 Tax=Bradyrhizobium elkanii TaxID=29448 RepID=UPI001449A4E1|nr:hypothetical protein [Bradyrhizobium elkanii]MCP1927834.1 hypothetical protein [Bradyrhizobium elkanii]MCS3581557.1 hypothetical protein [Bradyrhizobium elkanii]MCS3724431.1 hypothetical protein [Bradyrhizobium elkanii]MCS4008843.1 hypothetical protein [Bradyrhizobium elkanii USDA 61]WLA40842.1 hypothetical protein QNJ95_04720 [Bradyrhizobium elkanii]
MSFKVIDGGGPGKEERQLQQARELAENRFFFAIREVTANFLRIARGAGKPADLLLQMESAMDAALAFQKVYDRCPMDIIESALELKTVEQHCSEGVHQGKFGQADIDRWSEDGTFDRMEAEHTILRGALQVVASELLEQGTQKTAGKRELRNGVRQLQRVLVRKEAREAERARRASSKLKARKPRDASFDL